MKFPKKKKEVFVGSMRVNVNEETENFLRPLIPTKVRIIDGVKFYYYPDGRVEAKTTYEELMEKCKEIRKRK